MEPSVIIVDLDGTLCNIDHRVGFAQSGDWESFHSLVSRDSVYPDVSNFIGMISDRTKLSVAFGWAPEIWAISGREEKFLPETERWLEINDIIFDRIILRPSGDRTPDHQLKVRVLIEEFGSIESARSRVLFILEDRDKVIEAYRNAGLPCWQVRPGTY